MKVEVLTSLEQIDAARLAWDELFVRSGSDNYFVSFPWIRTCVARFLPPGQAHICAVMENDRLIALAPLRKNGRTLTFLMIPDLADYCEILCETGRTDAIAGLVAHWLADRDWSCVQLAGIPAHASCVAALVKALDDSGVPWHRQTICVSPLVRIDGAFDVFEKGLKKKVRQEVRTTQNHLRRLGSWHLEESTRGADALRIYDSLVQMHLGRQSGKAGRSLFESGATRDFLRSLIPVEETDRAPRDVTGPVLSALVVGNRVVAAAYSLSCKATFFYWIPSFDSDLRSVSLGKALIARLIEKRFEEGRKIFDFMGGNEAYKYQWSNGEYEVLAISVYRHRLGLVFWRARLWAVERLRVLVRAVPALRNLWVVLSKIT